MKIIRLSTFLDFGGIESKMANLSSIKDIENEWIFCAIGKGGLAEKKIIKNDKQSVCFNLPHKIPSIRTIIKLFIYFKKEKPQVVHTSGAEANFHGVLAAKLANVPVIIAEEIGIPNQNKKARFIFNWIYKLSDYVIGESNSVVENLKNKYKIDAIKLKVITNFTLFSGDKKVSLAVENEVFKILSVSRLEPVKNIEGIILAVYRLKKEHFKIQYSIVGDGSLKETIQKQIAELKLENEIKLKGFQNNPEQYFMETDLYVLNSFSEGFSNSLLEAMYYKKPSITTAVGAANEIIENGSNGWIINVDDENELYHKIKYVIGMETERRNEIGVKANETVVTNYSLQSHVDSLLALYKSKL
jgi:glycosyltransferase involved in cell wall biosynthesis